MRVLVRSTTACPQSTSISLFFIRSHSQVVLSIVFGVAVASNVAVPLVYARSAAILEPRKAFEYSSSVQTADYANYASVKSDNAGLAPVAITTAAVVPAVEHVAVKTIAPLAPIAAATFSNVYTPQVYAAAPAVYTHIPTAYAAAHHSYIQSAVPQLIARSAIVEPAPIVETVVEHAAPAVALLAPALALQKSQYHTQDSLGQAAYGHAEALQSHNAVQDAAGNKAGSYSYVAPDGRLLTTDYVADENGYRVATNALPIDPNHARRRRSLALAVSSVPLIKEATRTDIPGHSSTVRLDTYNANVLTAVHTAPAYYAAPLPHALTYAAYHPAAVGTYVY